jgi:hypothetical protein
MRSILWKEYREHRSIWLILALVALAALLGTHAALVPGATHPEWRIDVLAVVAVALAWTYGLVCGAMLLAGEREAGTQTFLDTFPTDRMMLWRAKCLAAGLFLLLMLLMLGGLSLWLGLAQPNGVLWSALVLFLGGLAGFGWGLFYSSLTRSVLAAIGLAIFTQFLLWGMAVAATFFLAVLVYGTVGWEAPMRAAPYVATLVWVIAPLPLSALVYSRVDRKRRPLSRIANGAVANWWEVWQQSLWLSGEQTRSLALGLGILCLCASPLVTLNFVVFWPLLTLAVGVLCGGTAFLDEQGGAYRFLGDQRLPLTRLWLTRVLLRLALACLGALILLLPSVFVFAIHEQQPASPSPRVLGSLVLGFIGSPLAFGCAWLVHGFAVGLLCGLIFRKPLVALVVSLGLAAVLASVWVPSILAGGLRVWQVGSVPVVLLVCAWLLLPAWASDRLASGRIVARLVLAGLLCVALIAMGLWYRVVEVPDVPVGSDLEGFVAGLPAEEDNHAGHEIRTALNILSDVEQRRPRVQGPRDNTPLVQCDEVIERGWPAAPPDLARWLDQVFANDLWRVLARITTLPTGVVTDPRRLTAGTPWPYIEPAVDAGKLLAARGLQMQKMHNRPEVFLDHFETALALVRNFENGAPSVSAKVARRIEAEQLEALDRWLEQLPNRADLLRRALHVLRKHAERPLPTDVEHRLADYLIALRSLDMPLDWLPLETGVPQSETANLELAVLATAWSVPWEQKRQERLVRYFYWKSDSQNRQFSRALLPLIRNVLPSRTDTLPRRRCLLDAAALKVALRLYQAEKGQPAPTLAALVPAYLSSIPADPFDNAPFRYRISQGEKIAWPAREGAGNPGAPAGGVIAESTRKVLPGQGVLWSVGEDQTDDGGKRRCEPRTPCRPGEDIIFLVPMPAR